MKRILAFIALLLAPFGAQAQELTIDDVKVAFDNIRKADLSTNASLAALSAVQFSPGVQGLQLGLGVGFETETGQPGAAAGVALGLNQHVMINAKAAATSGAGAGSHELLLAAGVTFVLGGR